MGIRFECPNGHKIHVKAFLAGRRGICPDCGAKFDIPHADAGRLPEAGDALSADRERRSRSATGAAASPHRSTAKPSRPTPPASTFDWEAAAAYQWFVCTAAGEQFGPATSQVLHKWLDEGRIGEETLLWREGWANWLAAGDILPELAGGDSPSGVAVVTPDLAGYSASHARTESATTEKPRSASRDRRRLRARRTVTALFVTVLFLLAVLIWVLINQSRQQQDSPTTAMSPPMRHHE